MVMNERRHSFNIFEILKTLKLTLVANNAPAGNFKDMLAIKK